MIARLFLLVVVYDSQRKWSLAVLILDSDVGSLRQKCYHSLILAFIGGFSKRHKEQVIPGLDSGSMIEQIFDKGVRIKHSRQGKRISRCKRSGEEFNFGIVLVYVVVNAVEALGVYWLVRVPKRGGGLANRKQEEGGNRHRTSLA
ncbi:CDR ABC transporter [Penicillium atrosanguineum]|uniref:CDR ABC transporter n=1 Tax=Penicillium atrosanguineum TaxID=1132637 RepID=A0A9W9HDL7_9EURO|nr:uncharacterized protein N7443_005653 [Penicillium atrosanguineum]KAJ5128531.1 CDR ABC transporter [Penicillium atrosanguineum]KAJ5144858.1 CDR ABC transporter [Penicillium atrosanguineum]KAJ5300651.1 hypothetical protein N7443_005653 [Penicillium atrosanguineum]KAJ5311292.1 CDR ABC transporter [Penicillium atrosanguineum]